MLQCPETYWILNDERLMPIAEKLNDLILELLVAYFRYYKDPDNYWKIKDEFDEIINPLKEEFGMTEDVDVIQFLIKYHPHLHNEKPKWDEDGEDHLYFIGSEDGYVKIGRSNNPKNRLSTIQSHNHKELKLLKVFKKKGIHERMVHDKFNDLRIRGEWFKMTDEIEKFIEEIENG